MNHLMERDTAAHDLAEVRKLIDSMNSLVNQQQQQQQRQQQELLKQQQQQQQQQKRSEEDLQKASDKYPAETPHDPSATSSTLGTTSPRSHTFSPPPATSSNNPLSNAQATTTTTTNNKLPPLTQNNAAAFLAAMAAAAAAANSQHTTQASFPNATDNNQTSPQSPPTQQKQPPSNGIVIEVTHLFFNRTLYFQLSLDATIEPLVAWLRLSFNDNSVSGMVLQYKGTDGLWKCLLNRDDSLKRVLNQSLKSNTTLLYMRVPREQDLLSSGYTDRRLLALTKPSGV